MLGWESHWASRSNPSRKVRLPGLARPNNQPDLLTALCRGPPGCHRSLPADPLLARPATWALPGLPAQLCRLRGGPFRRAASRRLRGPREPRDALTQEFSCWRTLHSPVLQTPAPEREGVGRVEKSDSQWREKGGEEEKTFFDKGKETTGEYSPKLTPFLRSVQ